MTTEDPLPWEPHPDPDVWDGLELPSGVFVTYPPEPACDCADCLEDREEGRDGA